MMMSILGDTPFDQSRVIKRLTGENDELRALLRFVGRCLEQGGTISGTTVVDDRALPGDDTTTVADLVAYYLGKGGAR